MKIAHIRDTLYPYTKGGAQKRVWEISKRLVSRGHEVHIFGMKYWDGDDIIMLDGVYLHGVCEPQKLFVGGRRSIKAAIYFSYKVLFPMMREDFDVVICDHEPYFHCFPAKIYSLSKRTPLIIIWHSVWGDYWYTYLGKKGIFGKVVEGMTAHLTDKNIAVSERTKKDLEGVGVKKEIKVIPNGIDFKKIEKINASTEKSDVIFVGRLIKDKHADLLIRAVELARKKIPDIRCMIIGNGPEKEKLKRLVHDLDLKNNIKFTGFLDGDDVVSYMKASKVFVLPSTGEGFALTPVEANACGLPVVTVNHKKNATCDFVNNGNGFICELSEEDIAEKIFIGLSERENMERNCIKIAKQYDWDGITDLTEKVYGNSM